MIPAANTKLTLGDIAEFMNGGAWSQGEYSEHGVPVVRVTDIKSETVDLSDCKFLPESSLSKYERHVLRKGDLVICTVGSHPTQPGSVVGRAAIIPSMADGALLNQNAVRLRAVRPNVDQQWLGYLGRSRIFHNYIISCARGSANQVRMAIGLLKEMPVQLPPLPAQRRIAGILSAYDELIENNLQRIRILEEMARALYREWFVHFRFPGFEHHPSVVSPLGEIPQGWEEIPFANLLASMTGGDWGSEQPADRDTAEVRIVRGTDFDEVAYGGQLRVPVRYIKPSSLTTRGLREGDVIIENSINAKSRCIGTTLLVDNHVLNRLGRDAVAASFCKVFRLHDPRLAPLVHLHVRHLREDARMEYYQNVAANGIGNFQAQKFAKEEHLVLPTDEAMRAKLIKPIAALFQSVGVLSSQLSNLRRTRELLLPRLLSGQIDVDAC